MFAPCVPIRCEWVCACGNLFCLHAFQLRGQKWSVYCYFTFKISRFTFAQFSQCGLLLRMTVKISIYSFFIWTNNKLLNKANSNLFAICYSGWLLYLFFIFRAIACVVCLTPRVSLIQLIAICVRVRCIVTFNTKPKYKCTQCIFRWE